MPEIYKVLGQIAPTDSTEKSLYTSPALTQTLVSNITVTNRSASPQTFDINVYNSAMNQATIDSLNSQSFMVLTSGSAGQYSTDSVTWTPITMPSNIQYIYPRYGNGAWVAVNNNNSTAAARSTNGITWTTSTLPVATSWTGLAYGNNVFVAMAYQSTTAASSTDGITWTLRTLPTTGYNRLGFGSGKFVALKGAWPSTTAMWSTDGITWTQNATMPSGNWYQVTGSPSLIVAFPYSSTGAASSTDAITWTTRTLPISGKVWRSPVYGNNTFLVISGNYGGGYSTTAARSTDGITWTASTLPVSEHWRTLAYGSNIFVATAYNSTTAASSTDGITWTLRTLPNTGAWHYSGGTGIPYSSPRLNNLYKNNTVAANSSITLQPGITLGSQNSIVAKGTSNLTFSAYGVELS
jgi:hypothetical protein